MFKDIVALTKVWRLIRWWKGGREGMDTSRLRSRKLWFLIAASVLVTVAIVGGLDETVIAALTTVAITYLGVQGLVDLSGGERDWHSSKLWANILGCVGITVAGAAEISPEIIDILKWLLVTFTGAQGVRDIGKGIAAKRGK